MKQFEQGGCPNLAVCPNIATILVSHLLEAKLFCDRVKSGNFGH